MKSQEAWFDKMFIISFLWCVYGSMCVVADVSQAMFTSNRLSEDYNYTCF